MKFDLVITSIVLPVLFTCSAFGQGACTTGSLVVTEPQPLVLTATTINQATCGNADGSVSVAVTGGNPSYQFLWDSGHSTAVLTGLNAGTYCVTLTDASGCTLDSCIVTGDPPPPAVCFSGAVKGCVPVTASFTNCTPDAAGCLWDFGDGNTSTDCDPTHVFTQPGCYDITLTVTSAAGCESTLTKPCYIEGFPVPLADFDALPWEVDIVNPVVNFIDKSIDAASWYWVFGDGDTSMVRHPTHIYGDTGCYPVTLYITGKYGCTDTVNEEVCVTGQLTIYVPNAFTPNGDGKNELFTVKQYGFCECEMYIFDRWGNEIYKTNNCTNRANGWPGTANGGTEIVQEDVYVWLVLTRDCSGKPYRRIGHVTLIR